MIRTFIEIPLFSKRWKEIGLTDEALLDLQLMILKDPESGPIIRNQEDSLCPWEQGEKCWNQSVLCGFTGV